MMPTVEPSAEARMPRSASSVTLNGSHPPSWRSVDVRKWFEVPPSGIGRWYASRPGSM
jgi:hypothetical protein